MRRDANMVKNLALNEPLPDARFLEDLPCRRKSSARVMNP